MTTDFSAGQRTQRSGRWLSWLLGAAVLSGVIVAANRFSEEQVFIRLVREAEPWWLIAAVALQAATYLAQGKIWRIVGRRAGQPLPLAMVYKLALAKLFVDQALPTAGVSGTVVVAQVLEKGALPRATVLAGVVIAMLGLGLAEGAMTIGEGELR
jgi:Mg2+-importing ATPase